MTGPAGVTIRSGSSDELTALAAVADDAALALSEAGFPWRQGCVLLPRFTACHAEGLLWTAVDGADHLNRVQFESRGSVSLGSATGAPI
jgi:hypothetical protein